MKIFVLIFLAVLSQPIQSQTILANEILTPVQGNQALELIDLYCADTWCEGDVSYKFNSIKCSKTDSTCVLNLNVKLVQEKTQTIASTSNVETQILHKTSSSEATCVFKEITLARQILTVSRDEDRPLTLTQTFMTKLNTCIRPLEEYFLLSNQ